MKRMAVIVGGLVTIMLLGMACADPKAVDSRLMAGPRPVQSPLYGVTADDISNFQQIAASSRHLPKMPTTRIYFDVKQPARYYARAVAALRPVSYLMGELLDSSDERHISTRAYGMRVKSYLAAFRDEIDLWEIGNEVKLYYNNGCGDGAPELDPVAFSRKYVPQAVRTGLDYVLLSYYEDNCHGTRPTAATWTSYFRKLHSVYPHALAGFGEIGMTSPVTGKTLASAKSLMRYYYGLRVKLPYYVGGYFWWYYDEDCLPYTAKPLWRVLRSALQAEAAGLRLPR